MLLLRLLPTREAMLVDLVLDLVRGVVHVYARVDVRRAHLRLRPLQRGEELGVDERGLGVLELDGDVAREPEVRVLVDRAGDEAHLDHMYMLSTIKGEFAPLSELGPIDTAIGAILLFKPFVGLLEVAVPQETAIRAQR